MKPLIITLAIALFLGTAHAQNEAAPTGEFQTGLMEALSLATARMKADDLDAADKAVAIAEQLAKSEDEHILVNLLRASVLTVRGKYEEARTIVEPIAANDKVPISFRESAYSSLGLSLEMQGKFDEELAVYEKLRGILGDTGSDFYVVQSHIAQSYDVQMKPELALAALLKVLQRQDLDEFTHSSVEVDVADRYVKAGDTVKARACLERALKIDAREVDEDFRDLVQENLQEASLALAHVDLLEKKYVECEAQLHKTLGMWGLTEDNRAEAELQLKLLAVVVKG